ncbi:WG repeat-containing protein [Listeria welshimeri]|nr:WG repeat-containing protein [Listeria welshimeri]
MNQAIKKATDTLTIKYDKSTQLQGITGSNNQEIAPCIYEEISYVKSLNQFIIKQQGLYGILDEGGFIIVETKYPMISTKYYVGNILEEGYYIQTEEGLGRINRSGKIIVEPKYNEINSKENNFYETETWSYDSLKVIYNADGQKLEQNFNMLNEGYLYKRVNNRGIGRIHELYNKKLELINDKVKMNYNSHYCHGYMQVTTAEKEGKSYFGFVDRQGKIITKELYDKVSDFTKDGLAIVVKDGKMGAINSKEEVIIPFMYDRISDFENGFALVFKNKLWGAFDNRGKQVLPTEYEALSKNYGEGFIYIIGEEVGFVDSNNHRYQLTTKDEGETFFYYDSEGNKASISNLDQAYPFLDKGMVACYNNKEGLINTLGEVIVPVKYDQISTTILGGIGYVKKGDFWAIINELGEVVTDFKYDLIGFLASGYCVGKIENKCTLLSSKGEVSENIFDYIGDKDEVGVFWDFGLHYNAYVPVSSFDFSTILNAKKFKNIHSLEINKDKLYFMTNLGYVDTNGSITEVINPILSPKQATNLIEDKIPLIIEDSGIVSLKNKIGKIPKLLLDEMYYVYYVEVHQKELLNTMLHYESSFLIGFTGAMMEWALYRLKDIAEERLNFNACLQRIQSLYVGSFNLSYLTKSFDWQGGFSKNIEKDITDPKEWNKLEYLSLLDLYIYKFSIGTLHSRLIASGRRSGQNATEMYVLVKAGLPKKFQPIFEEWVFDVLKRAKPYYYIGIKDIYSRSIPYDQRMDQLVPREFYFDKEYQWDRLENEKRIKAYLKQASIKENPYINHEELERNPISLFADQ